ncbi:MAG: alpha/beta hydrolase [Collinsella sp.]|nr:alpha/beta hydrolase [Collinsella sp.]
MIIEQRALWGDEPTAEHPATYTAYLAAKMPDSSCGLRPAVVICGGGGFTHIAPHEQEPVALEFLARGYQAFVLDYVTSSTGDVSYPNPQADLAKMIATVRLNAGEWGVDPERVVAVGFSAGGFICASLATDWRGGPFAALAGCRPEDARPDAVVLGYPVIDFAYLRDQQTRDPRIDLRVPKTGGKTGRDLLNEFLAMVTGGEATDEHLAQICPTNKVSRGMPPTFVWCAADDKTAPAAQVYPFACRMAEEGVVHEMHVFGEGGHGLSVANRRTECDNADRQAAVRPWLDLAFAFLVRVGIQ